MGSDSCVNITIAIAIRNQYNYFADVLFFIFQCFYCYGLSASSLLYNTYE